MRSERKEDSMYHDSERRKEAAEINASLYALRECVRFRRMQRLAELGDGPKPHVHVPYRYAELALPTSQRLSNRAPLPPYQSIRDLTFTLKEPCITL